MGNSDLQDEIAAAAAGLETPEDREIFAAGEAFAAQMGPPISALSQEAAAGWLGISRRRLRVMLSRGQLRPAEDGALIAADLIEQLAAHRASARPGRRRS